jgi:hypothetical protein
VIGESNSDHSSSIPFQNRARGQETVNLLQNTPRSAFTDDVNSYKERLCARFGFFVETPRRIRCASFIFTSRWLLGIRLHSYRNCPLDVWRFSPTRQYLICHRSGRLGDRVGYTLDFELTHYLKFQWGRVRLFSFTGASPLLWLRVAAAPASLFFGPNGQDRDGSSGYGRADPRAESTRYTTCSVFDS